MHREIGENSVIVDRKARPLPAFPLRQVMGDKPQLPLPQTGIGRKCKRAACEGGGLARERPKQAACRRPLFPRPFHPDGAGATISPFPKNGDGSTAILFRNGRPRRRTAADHPLATPRASRVDDIGSGLHPPYSIPGAKQTNLHQHPHMSTVSVPGGGFPSLRALPQSRRLGAKRWVAFLVAQDFLPCRRRGG